MHKVIETARARLTYANVVASAALFIALGGVSYAATQLPKNSVGTTQIKNGAVTKAKLDATAAKSLAGTAGAQGRPGADGSAGTSGADGAQGASGLAGSRGETGLTGAGLPGAQGATGPAGEDGAAGADGADGATGPAGPAGAAGTDGDDGAQGATGAAGPAGADGDEGARGATGAAGPAGADGDDGAQGATGATGPAGPEGPALGDYAYAAGSVFKNVPSPGQTVLTFPDGKILDGWTMPDDSTFTVPTTGRYRVSYSINVTVSGSAQGVVGLFINGARRNDTEAYTFAQGTYTMAASRVLMLNLTAGDTLQMLAWNANGAGSLNAGGNSSIAFERIA